MPGGRVSAGDLVAQALRREDDLGALVTELTEQLREAGDEVQLLRQELRVSQQQLGETADRLQAAYRREGERVEACRQAVALLEDSRRALAAAAVEASDHLALVDTMAELLRATHRECQAGGCATCTALDQARESLE